MRLAALVLGAVLLLGASDDADQGAWALLQRTKTVTVTYADYAWLYDRDEEGNASAGWAAEIHAGDWHRGESSQWRSLTNCRTHQAWVYDVSSDTLGRNDDLWIGACGISTDNQIVAVDRLAAIDDPRLGRLDVLRVTDRRFRRYYAIDKRGVIVRLSWAAANGSPAPCQQSEPVAILRSLPPGPLFTPQSLRRSAVPERYRRPPGAPQPVGLSGQRCAE